MPTTILRSAYRPPSYAVPHVDLHFALDTEATLVSSRLTIQRNPATDPGPLILLGEDMELLDLKVNGRDPAAQSWRRTATGLEIDLTDETAMVEVRTRIAPAANTTLSGLYVSRGGLFTQCEAEGFRRITYFPDRPDVMSRYTVTLEADRTRYPVLLTNGNLIGSGDLAGGRHFARWEDPFPKPSYLFALVAADLVVNERRIQTASGREVLLQIWVEDGNLDRTEHAMESLIRALRWDEERFGLELDLDRFMVVAVSDFNMGAMENKGLNIFNCKLLLATPDTATDVDYKNIEAVVGHEYFHNWTGNRVTCRDWFQLTLKEGLTVYRDQEFTADMLAVAGGDSARAVKRIDDVRGLRDSQFAEDAGPMAHPIRPDSYQEINNFYTATVYEKGAEVIRILATLLGRDGFRRGMDLYFARHDGQAVTCDDFVAAMADANGRDLGAVLGWYGQAGTPRLHATGQYDASTGTYTLTLSQTTPATPGQPIKQAVMIPVAVGLIGTDGRDLPLHLADEGAAAGTSRILELTAPQQAWTFIGLDAAPVPSLLRGFSAPVVLDFAEDDAALAFRMAHDSDPFNRWDAAQRYQERVLLERARTLAEGGQSRLPAAFLAAFERLLQDHSLSPAFVAQALQPPAEAWLLERLEPAQPDALRAALKAYWSDLGRTFAPHWRQLHGALEPSGTYRYDPRDAGQRALRNLCLRVLSAAGDGDLARAQFASASNLSERLGALAALVQSADPGRDAAIRAFEQRYATDPLVLDKWFAVQAGGWSWSEDGESGLDRVRRLMGHPAFTLNNPNKVYALLGTFFRTNAGEFHRRDGAGYGFWADRILELDSINPQVAARLARCLERWRAFAPVWRTGMQDALERVAAHPGLSRGVAEIVGKALAAD